MFCNMDPVTLIVTALATGAANALSDSAVRDAYESLKSLVRRRLGRSQDGQLALREHATAPERWEQQLRTALAEAGADGDAELLRAAESVLRIVQVNQTAQGKYNIQIAGAVQGPVIGDHVEVKQSFGDLNG
jgi:hypothetical protein